MKVRRRPEAERNPVREALVRYVASALVAMLLISLLGVELFSRTGHDEAIRDAKDLTRAAATGAVEPALSDAVLRGDERALAALDEIVRTRVLRDSSVVRVKIWDRSGRIVYSDEPALIGARFSLSPEDLAEFDEGRIDAEVSDLTKPENRFERQFGQLLEVYMPVSTRSGQPLLYEAYYRSSFVSARGRRIWREFAPVMLGALILLALIQLPLARRLAKRVQKAQREREELLQRAIDASDLERRRIARDLHDGVVQNLAGVSYSLTAVAGTAPADLAGALNEAAAETRQGIRELRTLLVEIYPPELQREGLEAALTDLLARCAVRGLETRLAVDEDVRLPQDVEALFFRTAQEALRNVVKHAGAERVDVRVASVDGRAAISVEDDGSGFDAAREPDGAHFGLRLLGDLASEAGGRLEVDSAPGRGTKVRLEVGFEQP